MKKTLKRTLIALICFVCIFSSVSAFAFEGSSAYLKSKPIAEEGFNNLCNKFSVSTASNGMKYASYSPVIDENDNTKYPLVVYVHGLGHAWNDNSFKQSGLTYWACREMQSKFKEGGAHLLMPKIPEYKITATQHENVFKVIEEYCEANSDSVDMTQVYVMGGSAGGALAWRLLINHPDFFAKGVMLCACKFVTSEEAKKIADIPVWEISAVTDPLVWFSIFQRPTWANIKRTTRVAEQCRWTVFSGDVTLPEGTTAVISHLLAKTIGFNLCTISDKQVLKGMTTVDGNEKAVELSFENAVVEWFQQ